MLTYSPRPLNSQMSGVSRSTSFLLMPMTRPRSMMFSMPVASISMPSAGSIRLATEPWRVNSPDDGS
ncbi:hypothetical protein D3C85_1770990 [compost metagenome]